MDSLNRHRGRGLTLIQRHLQGGSGGMVPTKAWVAVERKQKSLITLVSVIMLLAQEIQMSATKLWVMHLNAAKSVVKPLGGIPTLWVATPPLRSLYTLLVMIDIMSTTTSPVETISFEEQIEHLESVPHYEDLQRKLLASFMPCPVPILTTILRTNVLRAALHHDSVVPVMTLGEAQEPSFAQFFNATLGALLRFDPRGWAQHICDSYLSHPQPRPKVDNLMLAWAALATAYQSAAVMYLLRAVQSERLPTTLVPEATNAKCLLQEQRRKMDASIALLFKDLSEKMKATSLWRFMSWPLFIYSYELVGWSEVAAPDNGDRSEIVGIKGALPPSPGKETIAAIRKMQQLGRRLGANCIFDAVELLEGAWKERHRKAHGKMDWDDGFAEWCVFMV